MRAAADARITDFDRFAALCMGHSVHNPIKIRFAERSGALIGCLSQSVGSGSPRVHLFCASDDGFLDESFRIGAARNNLLRKVVWLRMESRRPDGRSFVLSRAPNPIPTESISISISN